MFIKKKKKIEVKKLKIFFIKNLFQQFYKKNKLRAKYLKEFEIKL